MHPLSSSSLITSVNLILPKPFSRSCSLPFLVQTLSYSFHSKRLLSFSGLHCIREGFLLNLTFFVQRSQQLKEKSKIFQPSPTTLQHNYTWHPFIKRLLYKMPKMIILVLNLYSSNILVLPMRNSLVLGSQHIMCLWLDMLNVHDELNQESTTFYFFDDTEGFTVLKSLFFPNKYFLLYFLITAFIVLLSEYLFI